GVVNLQHATGLGAVSQIAFNPVDGYCYVATSSPLLPVIMSQVQRVEPSGGTTALTFVPVIAQGFTIDDQGRWIFGGAGVQAPGIHRYDPNAQSPTLVYLDPGLGMNRHLLALGTNDVIVADQGTARRLPAGGGAS